MKMGIFHKTEPKDAISKDFLEERRRNVSTIFALIGVFLIASAAVYFVIKHAIEETIEAQAITVAEIVAAHATTARSVYALKIAEKLKQDGFGPHVNSDHKRGYVPIPAKFLKLVGDATTANTAELFHYKPISKWNLEPAQGISDDFLAWAWPQLEKQDVQDPLDPISWKPVWRFELSDGRKTLRYLSADAASQMSCVTCHNTYEKHPEVISRRIAAGIMPGKQWKQHQLLGALDVSIPLDKIENVAAGQIQITTALIFATLLASFLAMIWFNKRLEKQGRSLSSLSLQATHDPLTEFLNRRGFEVEIERFFKITKTSDTHHVVLLIDIDYFKRINDTYGHHVGDALLKQIGINLPNIVRPDDVISRLGGDEFAVLLFGYNEKDGLEIAEKICQEISRMTVEVKGSRVGATVSIGMAVMNGSSGSTSAVLNAADVACYVAKRNGRNQVHVYEKSDDKTEAAQR